MATSGRGALSQMKKERIFLLLCRSCFWERGTGTSKSRDCGEDPGLCRSEMARDLHVAWVVPVTHRSTSSLTCVIAELSKTLESKRWARLRESSVEEHPQCLGKALRSFPNLMQLLTSTGEGE